MGQLILSEKGCFMYRPSTVLFLLAIGLTSARAQTPPARPARPAAPTRDAHTPGYVMAKELPDGENAPATVDGNFILGPTHKPAPESTVREGVPQGTVYNFTMESTDSEFYPGIAREPLATPTRSIQPTGSSTAILLPTRAALRFMFLNNMFRAPRRRSSLEPTAPTGCYSPYSTT